MKRIYSWDNLKFFAMICILFLHSTIPYAEDKMHIMKYIHPFINFYPMVLFTITSGFWYKDKSFKELVLLFLWPCVLFTIINDVLGYFFYPNYFHYFKFKPGYAMWYLMALFLYSITTKYIRRHLGSAGYLLLAFFIAFIIGFIPVSNNYFEIQRISCLFPCFAYGVFLKDYTGNQLLVDKFKRRVSNIRLLSAVLFVLIIIINVIIIHYFPEIEKRGLFKAYYGLNLIAALKKWFLMFMRIVACTCLIVLVPNKEYWFTKYGARTMNVYLLHITPIFILCWGLLYNYRYEWYGLLSCFVVVPLICTLFFSKGVDKVMKKVLFEDYIKKLKKQ